MWLESTDARYYDGPVASGVTSWIAARRASDTFRSLTLIVAAVIVANGAFIFFGYESGAIWWTSSIAARVCAWSCGIPTVDPNVGFITQPLGHVAALDLLHGHLPWWNYFEGMGQPLVGEMQSAALLPLVILFVFPAGLLLFHLALQIIAGASTYFLVRRLGIGPTIATLAGTLFALNGTFAWIGNAAINPVAFLPLLILGIEVALDHGRTARRNGWVLLAVAVALSIVAGFPEMAYLDGLLAGGWAVTRLCGVERTRRIPTVGRLALGGGVGLALALPVLTAFLDFTRSADIGAHAAHGLSVASTPVRSLPILLDPYLGGTLFGGPTATPNNLLGYVTASVAVFAVVGSFGRRLRPLRWFLAGWVAAVLAGVVNVAGLRFLWNLVPGMGAVAFARYIWPTLEFSVIILAVLGLSDVVEYAAHRRSALYATVGVALVCLVGVFIVVPLGGHVRGSYAVAVAILITLPFATLAVVGFALRFLEGRTFVALVTAMMVVESLAFIAVPSFRNPVDIHLAPTSLSYLQEHEGLGRFLSLGVLNPNWGSQFGLNEINAIDLPSPQNFVDYVHAHLAPSLNDPRTFVLPFTPAVENEVAAHVAQYEALGVAYLLVKPQSLTPALSAVVGTTPVAKDYESDLYALPHPQTFYSTTLATCDITASRVDRVVVDCPSATTLTRLELTMPGWSARVNGQPVPITSIDGLTQSVAVPPGVATVTFTFLPPHERWAMAVFLLALVGILATRRPWSWRLRSRRPRAGDDPDGTDPSEIPAPQGDALIDTGQGEGVVASTTSWSAELHDLGEAEQ